MQGTSTRRLVFMTLLSLLAVGWAGLEAYGQTAAAQGIDFPMTDYQDHLKPGLTVDDAKAWADTLVSDVVG